MNTSCPDVLHGPKPEEDALYLYQIFTNNDISLSSFIQEVNNIITMKYSRINALVLRGPTSTGKTLIAKNIVKPYNYGTVPRDGDAISLLFTKSARP